MAVLRRHPAGHGTRARGRFSLVSLLVNRADLVRALSLSFYLDNRRIEQIGSGVFTVTGNPLVAAVGRTAQLDPGSFSVVGQDVTLSAALAAYALQALSGSYSVTGVALTVKADRWASLAPGSFAVTGVALQALHGRRAQLQAGSFSVTGNAIAPLAGLRAQISSGSFTLSGQPVSLLDARRVALSAGAFDVSGKSVNLLFGRRAIMGSGAYSVTGGGLDGIAARRIAVLSGSFAVSGEALIPFVGYTLQAETGAFELVGGEISLRHAYGGSLRPVEIVARATAAPSFILTMPSARAANAKPVAMSLLVGARPPDIARTVRPDERNQH